MPAGGAHGVGDEYAISVAANPAADQSAHRRSADPNRRRSVSQAPEGVFFHAAKGSDARKSRTPSRFRRDYRVGKPMCSRNAANRGSSRRKTNSGYVSAPPIFGSPASAALSSAAKVRSLSFSPA
jgi:hypothetical protein